MTIVSLLDSNGALQRHELSEAPPEIPDGRPPLSREVFAAAHVVPTTWAENTPGGRVNIDWDATLAFRRNVWSWGLGVADAMDTAQRNMGLDWPSTVELIRRSAAESHHVGGALVVGVNTDHVPDATISLDAVVEAYLLQLDVAEEAGAGVVLMASRHLARAATSPQDYRRVYASVIEHASSRVVLHWLGEAFDVQLAGYFGSSTWEVAARTVLEIIEDNVSKVRGIKMSLLDVDAEIAVRRSLPEGVRLYTGDDFHYVDLIRGDDTGHSDALLGAFAAVAPRAAVALRALDDGDLARYAEVLEPTEALARQVFAAPTQYYKTGIAFLSWVNGHQPSFQMIGGLHAGRSLAHLSQVLRLADAARALERPELAAARWMSLLAMSGIRA